MPESAMFMNTLYSTQITSVGPDVSEMIEGGVLILFADGAPPELAEVSVLHRVIGEAADDSPEVGALLRIGDVAVNITGVGPLAWNKVREIGHVVINFNGASKADRPGEICAEAIDVGILATALVPGAVIEIAG